MFCCVCASGHASTSVRYTCSVVCVLVVTLQQVSGTHVLLGVC